MGQSNSRSPRPSPSTPSPSRRADTPLAEASSSRSNGQSSSSSSIPESSSSAAATKKSSRRRSVLSLVSRSSSGASSNRKDKEDSSQQHSTSLRKRWRSSRRFSKAHSPLNGVKEPQKEASIPESAHDHSHNEAPSTPPVETQLVGSSSPSSRPSTPFPISRPTTPHADSLSEAFPEALSQEERQLSENIGNWLSGSPQSTYANIYEPEPSTSRPSHPDGADIEREINELLASPAETSGNNSAPRNGDTAADAPAEPIASAAPQAPSRHFPSPGTLVVVQGVVNTTDAPPAAGPSTTRHNNSSAPPPPAPESLLPASTPAIQRRSASAPRPSHRSGNATEGTRRTGLSSLMPRPSSMITRRPSSSSRTSGAPASNRHSDPPPLSEPIAVHAQESSSSSEISENSQTSDSDTAATPADSEGGPRALSPGSIDVLGTLLSVAAAATAASLFSPGFSNPANTGSPSQSAASRPMSPTPTAGLGGFGGLNRLAELSLDPPSNGARTSVPQPDPLQNDRDTRDRIRSVWDNFRERLGLSPRGNGAGVNTGTAAGDGGDSENGNSVGPGQTSRMRPGELMLAEMARALNAGLGLANSNERRSTDQGTPSGTDRTNGSAPSSPTNERTRPLSPDPGFEAFLTNLQADLRTVLSGNPPTTATDGGESQSDGQEVSDPLGSDEEGSSPADSDGPQHEADVPADVLPFAYDDADSDLVSDVEDVNPSPTPTERPIHHARTPTPIPPASTLPHIVSPEDDDEASPRGDRRQPAINLWRVYRFPPIPAPPGHALRMSVLPTPSVPVLTTPEAAAASSPPTTHHLTPETPGSDSAESAATTAPLSDAEPAFAPTSANPVDLNVVVPVIVVGLQSVDTAPDRGENFEDGSAMPHDDIHRHDDVGFDSPEDFGVPPHDIAMGGGRPTTPRGRSWQSRAANALRGLRPGRRNGSRGRRANDNAGSRTFLIYVIGGYYPPNHHVVTGSDSLDSYEALWELADLLGQVKPPVATREDIEKSGLEIVKASEMKQLEQEGRIATNCMDRCLICLDDYEPQNDVRVMSCRHAFHKECVDKWLQVGRNNCPACRSKGVSTPGDSATASPPPTVPLA